MDQSALEAPVERKEQGNQEYDIEDVHPPVKMPQIKAILWKFDKVFTCVGAKKS
jgi:hypothetical protein